MKKFAVSLACLLVASTSACSFQAGITTNKVKAADVQSKIATEIKAQTGYDATVSCPEDLAGRTGAKLTCTADVNGKTYPVNVSVTTVEKGNISYSWKLDNSGDKSSAPSQQPSAEPTDAPSEEPTSEPSAADSPSSDETDLSENVNAQDVDEAVRTEAQKTTSEPVGVVCDPLKAEVGAKTECGVLAGEQEQKYEVEVTNIADRRASLKITRVS